MAHGVARHLSSITDCVVRLRVDMEVPTLWQSVKWMKYGCNGYSFKPYGQNTDPNSSEEQGLLLFFLIGLRSF